jgi:hypothetical protein
MRPIRREFRSPQEKCHEGIEAAGSLADRAARTPGGAVHSFRFCGRTVMVSEAITAGVLIFAAGAWISCEREGFCARSGKSGPVFLCRGSSVDLLSAISMGEALAAEIAPTPNAAHELKRTAQVDADALIQESEDLRRQMRSLRDREPPAWLRAHPPVAQPGMPAPPKPEEPGVAGNAPPPGSGEQRLLQRAAALIESRDIAGARLILEKAYAEGSTLAAYRLAQTYDPDMLRAWGIIGIRGDPARAKELYAVAGAGGAGERDTSAGRQK